MTNFDVMRIHVLRFFFFGLLAISVWTNSTIAQQIIIDENYDDWSDPVYSDAQNDGSASGTDIYDLYVDNDDQFLYISFTTDKEFVLQNNFGLSLYIDIDDNTATGDNIAGIGADLIYPFSVDREKTLFTNGFGYQVRHDDLGFIALPSVSSSRFELRINRTMKAGGNSVSIGSDIRVVLKDSFGDQLPDSEGGVAFSFSDKVFTSTVDLEKIETTDVRVLSLNVKQDGYFESNSKEAINRILRAINPDIIAFQEIYDHTASETEIQVATALNLASSELHSARVFPDIILVSKYPIEDVGAVAGNGVFKVNTGDRDWVIINCHLACCDNDDQRNEEVAEILEYIEDIKTNSASVSVAADSPILILGDMNFVGDSQQPEDFLSGQAAGPDWGGNMEDSKPLTTGSNASFTWYNEFSSFSPGRLDYLIYSGSVLKVKNSFNLFTPSLSAEILDSYGLGQNDSQIASDHLAVVVDFDSEKISTADQLESEKWLLYPNPSASIMHIGEGFKWIEIRNSSGQLLSSASKPHSQIDVSALPSGTYLFSGIRKGKKHSQLFQKL